MRIRYMAVAVVICLFTIWSTGLADICWDFSDVCCEHDSVVGDLINKDETWNLHYQDETSDSVYVYGKGEVCDTEFFGPTECWPYFNGENHYETDNGGQVFVVWTKQIQDGKGTLTCGCQPGDSNTFGSQHVCTF